MHRGLLVALTTGIAALALVGCGRPEAAPAGSRPGTHVPRATATTIELTDVAATMSSADSVDRSRAGRASAVPASAPTGAVPSEPPDSTPSGVRPVHLTVRGLSPR